MAFISFGEAHAGGHYLWHAGDSEYPLQPNCPKRGTEYLLRDVYAAIDASIGEILQSVDDDTTVVVMSVDGMGPNYSATHFMPEFLHRQDLFFSNTVGRGQTPGRAALPRKSVLRRIREAIPLPVRQSVTRCMPRRVQHWLELKWLNSGVDWGRSKVIPIPSSNEAYFRINLMGREPQGIVEAGSEYDELIEQLQCELKDLVNPLNSQHICAGLPPVDALCRGPLRSNLPDVVAKWDANARVSRYIESSHCGRIESCSAHEKSPFYTGEHRNVAFAICRGPSIAENATANTGHIMDVAPTILSLFGVEPPREMQGQIWL
jgi:predicted AlkP superfamily phosphohydrolase/phosphomutase